MGRRLAYAIDMTSDVDEIVPIDSLGKLLNSLVALRERAKSVRGKVEFLEEGMQGIRIDTIKANNGLGGEGWRVVVSKSNLDAVGPRLSDDSIEKVARLAPELANVYDHSAKLPSFFFTRKEISDYGTHRVVSYGSHAGDGVIFVERRASAADADLLALERVLPLVDDMISAVENANENRTGEKVVDKANRMMRSSLVGGGEQRRTVKSAALLVRATREMSRLRESGENYEARVAQIGDFLEDKRRALLSARCKRNLPYKDLLNICDFESEGHDLSKALSTCALEFLSNELEEGDVIDMDLSDGPMAMALRVSLCLLSQDGKQVTRD